MTSLGRGPGVFEQTVRRPIAIFAAALLGVTALVSTASSTQAADDAVVVFDNSPSFAAQGNYPSQSWQYGIEQYGDIIELGGDARVADTASIWLNSWACETGAPSKSSCETTPGATYTAAMTLRIFAPAQDEIAVSLDEQSEVSVPLVGDEIIAVTENISVPYRPSSDSENCEKGDYTHPDTGTCEPAVPFLATFDLAPYSLELPDTIIVVMDRPSLGVNKTGHNRASNVLLPGILDSGASDPEDYPANEEWSPTVGSDPAVSVNYVMGTEAFHSALGEGILGPVGWGPTYRPAFIVTAKVPAVQEPSPGPENEHGATVTESVTLGDTKLTFHAVLGEHPSGEIVLSASSSNDPSEFGHLPGDAQFGFGAQSFELNVAVGTKATVIMETLTPANTLFKSIDNEWSQYPATFDGTTITFELVDGGVGDADGEANGVIVDPVAAAITATFAG